MIIDSETNHVYFSNLFSRSYRKEYREISKLLDCNNITHSLLNGTKDIWCRDYMPIQVDEAKFVRFKYEPWYLNDTEEHKKKKSNPEFVCSLNNIKTVPCEINLDGGNVVKWKDKVILTARIEEENEGYKDKDGLIAELAIQFKSEIILIPALKKEIDTFGHADGIIRFYDSDTLIVNELEKEYKYWVKEFLKALNTYHFDLIEIPWFIDKDPKFPDSAVGNYLNFLEVGNLILLPEYEGVDEFNKSVKDIFIEHYPGRRVESVDMTRIAKEGGVLNCITWNIKL